MVGGHEKRKTLSCERCACHSLMSCGGSTHTPLQQPRPTPAALTTCSQWTWTPGAQAAVTACTQRCMRAGGARTDRPPSPVRHPHRCRRVDSVLHFDCNCFFTESKPRTLINVYFAQHATMLPPLPATRKEDGQSTTKGLYMICDTKPSPLCRPARV